MLRHSVTRLCDSDSNLSLFSIHTFPALSSVCYSLPDDYVAVGLYIDGRPAGLALGSLSQQDSYRLHSLMVEPCSRRQGFGRILLKTWENEVAASGGNSVECYWTSRLIQKMAFENTLTVGHWSRPRLARVINWCNAEKIACADLEDSRLKSLARLRLKIGLTVAQWQSTDSMEVRKKFSEKGNGAFFYPSGLPVDPIHLEKLNATVSVCIRCHGELVGWVITGSPLRLCPPPLTESGRGIWIQSVWIAKEYACLGLALVGVQSVAQAMVRELGSGVVLGYDSADSNVIAMTEKRFQPFVVKNTNIYSSEKNLSNQ